MQELQPYLFIFIGIMGTLLSLFWKASKGNLKKTGVKAEGVIFNFGGDSNSFANTSTESNIQDKVQIRFVTEKNEWITGYIKQDFVVFFSGQYKAGQKVEVYYDPNSPNDYFIATGQSEIIVRVVFCLLSLALTGFGILQLVWQP